MLFILFALCICVPVEIIELPSSTAMVLHQPNLSNMSPVRTNIENLLMQSEIDSKSFKIFKDRMGFSNKLEDEALLYMYGKSTDLQDDLKSLTECRLFFDQVFRPSPSDVEIINFLKAFDMVELGFIKSLLQNSQASIHYKPFKICPCSGIEKVTLALNLLLRF